MAVTTKAIEATGTIDDKRQLVLNEPLPVIATTNVRVLEEESDIDEIEWLKAAAAKVRLAVSLTEPIGPYRHVILAFITTRILTDLLETGSVIEKEQADFTGLQVTSTL
jgi:hypothetical protein